MQLNFDKHLFELKIQALQPSVCLGADQKNSELETNDISCLWQAGHFVFLAFLVAAIKYLTEAT